MIAITGLDWVSVYLSIEIKIVDYPNRLKCIHDLHYLFLNYYTIIIVNKVETNLMD